MKKTTITTLAEIYCELKDIHAKVDALSADEFAPENDYDGNFFLEDMVAGIEMFETKFANALLSKASKAEIMAFAKFCSRHRDADADDADIELRLADK